MSRLTGIALLLLVSAVPAGASDEGKGREQPNGGYLETGWLIHAGYFFHDTMFYGSGRGGPHAAAGRIFRLIKQAGLWVEAGFMASSGTLDTTAGDGSYRTHFGTHAGYLAAGPSLKYWPIPVGLAVYFHGTELDDVGLSGPLAGTELTGRESGIGLGIVVNIFGVLGEKKKGRGFRARATVGYAGFIDSTRPDIAVSSALGDSIIHRKWKAFRGESLRAGVELDF